MLPLEHLVPWATFTHVTLFDWSQVPTLVPSGEQMDCPGVEQELTLAPPVVAPEDGGAAPEPDELLPVVAPVPATEGAAGAALD